MTSPSSPRSLASWIDSQPVLLDAAWLETLDARKREEASFHDSVRSEDGEHAEPSNVRFYEAAEPIRVFVKDWIDRTVPGKTFLDYASGLGIRTVDAARAGAALAVGIDISPISVRQGERRAEIAAVRERTRFLQRDCEATGFPDASFDTCLCSGMLHHLDLSVAFPELARIMKPGGRVLCFEALGYNPVIQWYRNRTPELRTAWEKDHILTLREVDFARRWFRVENVRFHLMAAPAAVLLPRAIRKPAIALGHLLDVLLTRVPLLQRLSWVFTFELVKP